MLYKLLAYFPGALCGQMYIAYGCCLFSALKRIRGSRPFVLTRSSYPSLGHYAAHWTGDIHSSWSDLNYSIPGYNNYYYNSKK